MPVDKVKEKEIEEKCRTLIKEARFLEAAKIMEAYRTPLHDYMGAHPIKLDREVAVIYQMYQTVPDQLRGLSSEFAVPMREELAYMFLRGTNTIRKFMKKPTNIPDMTIGVAMIILMNRAYQLQDIDDNRKKSFVRGFEILDSKGDLCPECKKLCGKYALYDNIPALPNPKCSKIGQPCLPLMLPIIGKEEKPKKKGFFGLF